MRIKKIFAGILSGAMLLQFIPTSAFALANSSQALVKEAGYHNFPAYYSDVHHANNQVTHPDVVVMDSAWNGYRYWAIYTPNVSRISIYENPSIVASNDGKNWVEPAGLLNPIEPQPSSTRYHNCDADMLYNAQMDAMMAYWNWADDQYGGVGAEIRLRISYDGIHWGVPVTYDSSTRVWAVPSNDEERQVITGDQAYITAIESSNRYDMLSPAFVYDDYRDVFIMWANDTGDVGYNNGHSNQVKMRYSKDGITWGSAVAVNNFLGTNENNQPLAPWHQDVRYIDELKEFIAVSQCFAGSNPDGSVLHLTKSKDGLNWEQAGTLPILSPGEDGSWDDFQIYRSSFYYAPGENGADATFRLWYSALQKNTVNKLVSDPDGNLTIQAKDQDDRIWRIGYAENSYVDMMKVLLQDSSYSIPALVSGTSLSLTANTGDRAIYIGETARLSTVFSPANTSDQIVKFSSSNPTVASVNEFGIVTAQAAGAAVITGETREGLSAQITITVSSGQLSAVPQSDMTASATSEHPSTAEGPASYVLDGSLSTIWHTKYNPKDELPQSLTVTFDHARNICKYVYTPRQTGSNGIVTTYELYALKQDGSKVLVASGTWEADHTEKAAYFTPVKATGIEMKVLAAYGGFGSAAEINVYELVDTETVYTLSGNGVQAVFDSADHELTLYRINDGTATQLGKGSNWGYPVIQGVPVTDFDNYTCALLTDINGFAGNGNRMTIESHSASSGLLRTYVLETSNTLTGVIYSKTTYKAEGNDVSVDAFVDNRFELYEPGSQIWSYNGGGEGPQSTYDTLQKIDLTDASTFYRENIQDYRAAGIPLADIYTASGGIAVGDASATRREVRTPVQETGDTAIISIKWPGREISSSSAEIGQGFIALHPGDYFSGLRMYANAMEYLGVVMIDPEDISDRNYDLRWESWGWEFNWTVDLIIGKLDELQAAGVKQITLDDGWYDNAGDWGLNSQKFPNGAADMRRLTNAIHAHGMTAILWWRPCDGGRQSSALYTAHPEYFVKNQDGSIAKLSGPGSSGQFNGTTGYALCPSSEGALASQVAFVNRAMNEWGFDGFKGDYVWSMPKCYDETHNHAYPEESTENQARFYQVTRAAMVANDVDCFTMLCNCGTPQDYYSLQYVTHVATADPTSVDQTRRRVKAYKALLGDFFPVTTDHNEIWYPSAVGTGAVLIEKRAFTGAAQAEYEKWLAIANREQLQKGRFIGDLYCYGFDPYETYVVEKDGTMYYAFYRDGTKYRPSGSPDVELKGLNPNKLYRVVDYVNDTVVATNVPGNNAVFSYGFTNYLLVKAIELTEPDPEQDPSDGFIQVDAMDESLVYSGTWVNDYNSDFYNGTAKYTTQTGAAVAFTFEGTGFRWYGQRDTNFGEASVFVDDELIESVSVYGSYAPKQLLCEVLGLTYGTHTVRITCSTPVIDIDKLTYTREISESAYTLVNATSNRLTYSGTWVNDENASFYSGTALYSTQSGAAMEFTFTGTAIRWYGQKDTNFGAANVYLDGELVANVNVNGSMQTGLLLFERTGLAVDEHVLRIVVATPVVDIDYLSYA